MEKKYTVYVHTFPDGKMYFGKTSLDVRLRWKSGHGYNRNPIMWQAIQEVGWNNIEHSIIKTGLSEEEAAALETHYIEEFKTNDPLFGYNRSKGDGNLGLEPWKGKHHTEETKQKISLAKKGKHRVFTEEWKQKLSEAGKGRVFTEEWKQKISEAKKGVHKPKCKWLTPDGSIREMSIQNAKCHHQDWKQIID